MKVSYSFYAHDILYFIGCDSIEENVQDFVDCCDSLSSHTFMLSCNVRKFFVDLDFDFDGDSIYLFGANFDDNYCLYVFFRVLFNLGFSRFSLFVYNIESCYDSYFVKFDDDFNRLQNDLDSCVLVAIIFNSKEHFLDDLL